MLDDIALWLGIASFILALLTLVLNFRGHALLKRIARLLGAERN